MRRGRTTLVAAATLALGALAAPSRHALASCECDRNALEVVFVFDSTGSMGGTIGAVKSKIEKMIAVLTENIPRVRVGIVTYRDVGDVYVKRGIPLTENYDEVAATMHGIRAEGGGDAPEAVDQALGMAVQEMGWAGRASKVIVLIGDAPPHDEACATAYGIARMARREGIVVHTVAVSGASLPAFEEIARQGGGRHVSMDADADLVRRILSLSLGREWTGDLGDAELPPETDEQDAAAARGAFVFAQIRAGEDWNPPHAAANVLAAMGSAVRLDAASDVRVVSLTDSDLSRFPFLYLSGHDEPALGPQERDALRLYLERGGCLFAEACCGSRRFDRGFRKTLAEMFPEAPLTRLPPDHRLYRAGVPVESVEVAVVHGADRYRSAPPELWELDMDARTAVIYSPLDLGCGWNNRADEGSCQVRERDSLALTVDILLYLLGE
ncbi:MAG: DUF4159 domain-containing protein [Planctomycetes bacterium]|nr:DUF4159 domain-containing protein [Planctomycetota bacterium]